MGAPREQTWPHGPYPMATTRPRRIPASILHPHEADPAAQAVATWIKAFRQAGPVYATLSLVPLAFRLRRALADPWGSLGKAARAALQSTVYISTFVASYMALIDLQRRLVPWDHKAVYGVAGGLASLTTWMEGAERRAELLLYTVPRAIEVLRDIMFDHKVARSMPGLWVAVFGVSLAVLLRARETAPGTVGRLTKTVVDAMLPSRWRPKSA